MTRTHRPSIHHPATTGATDFAAVRSRLPPLAVAALCLGGCATATDASPPVAAPQTVAAASIDDDVAAADHDADDDRRRRHRSHRRRPRPHVDRPRHDGDRRRSTTGRRRRRRGDGRADAWRSPATPCGTARCGARPNATSPAPTPAPSGMDFTPMLARLQPVVAAADVGVCHLETPIAPDGQLHDVPAVRRAARRRHGDRRRRVRPLLDGEQSHAPTVAPPASIAPSASSKRTASGSRGWPARPPRSPRRCSSPTGSGSPTSPTRSATTASSCPPARSGDRR